MDHKLLNLSRFVAFFDNDLLGYPFTVELVSYGIVLSRPRLLPLAPFQDAISKWPPLRPLCLILKIFLQQRELNEV